VSELNPKPSLPVHVGATTALACWLATLLALALHLDNPWWATISAWVVANPERDTLLDKAGNRILGTVLGCVISYWLTLSVESRPLFQMAAMCAIAAVGIYGRFRSQQSYAWIIGAVGALAILSISLATPGEIFHIAVYRACEVICGVTAVTFIELLLYRTSSPVHSNTAPAKKTNPPTMDRSSALRLAMIGGISMIVILLLWLWLNLPSLPQIIVTCVVVLDRDGASTHFRGLQRILGCLVGGACGLLTVSLGPDSFFIWSVMLVGGIFLFSLIHHGGSRWAYVGTQGGVAFILALVTGVGPPDSMVPAVSRIAGMLCGVGILLCIYFVFEQMRENRAQVQRALEPMA
jgi:uncharacterized membrane protein YccC